MNPGLAQGFVRFGTTAHAILLTLHTLGPQTLPALREAIYGPGVALCDTSANLTRLHRLGFVFPVGRERQPGRRISVVFGLRGGLRYGWATATQPFTAAERSRTYRVRKRVRVGSVFAFRGTISITKPGESV